MPMITVRYTVPHPGADLRPPVSALAARLAFEQLGKDYALTTVLAEPAESSAWFTGGTPLVEAGLSAFWLEITVTAGTNTKAETTSFVKEAFSGMNDLLGPLAEHSYVRVHAADGDSYGYGGRTQSGRWAEANPDGAQDCRGPT
ncbi:4-oxalocrotonate tautomerase [Lichenicola cladoniae]|uniref:4-oxalocrotonate tautomerase n=1 Tax=Lichenicola cladoniae TaxID=1484109 RepID=A0A6M8HSE2_9PROT|nr:4-oxalocrotonate tautomerase [Lichenicola cladoniae]NPD65553.1 4-oxalocrotonate tautomerase [Acetobacteraceae bacterium]QKE91403.1 4-oxalocrotonate tautomerase [Lichenicola cladoniae]